VLHQTTDVVHVATTIELGNDDRQFSVEDLRASMRDRPSAKVERVIRQLAVARAAIDHDHRAIVANDLCMMVTDTMSRSGVLHISGHHAHAVAVMAE
jgi:hypothetical protein